MVHREEADHLALMTVGAEIYENEMLGLQFVKQPKSLPDIVHLFMYENNLNQAKPADLLGITKPKISQIITGKRNPDVPFLKAIYNKMHIDPKFILDHI